jgi:hypothetical protein
MNKNIKPTKKKNETYHVSNNLLNISVLFSF